MTTGTAAQWETGKEYFQCLMSKSLRVSDLPRIVKYSSCARSVNNTYQMLFSLSTNISLGPLDSVIQSSM